MRAAAVPHLAVLAVDLVDDVGEDELLVVRLARDLAPLLVLTQTHVVAQERMTHAVVVPRRTQTHTHFKHITVHTRNITAYYSVDMLETTTNTACRSGGQLQVESTRYVSDTCTCTCTYNHVLVRTHVCILVLPSDVNKRCLPLRVALFSRLEEIAGGRLLTHDVARRLITLASVYGTLQAHALQLHYTGTCTYIVHALLYW